MTHRFKDSFHKKNVEKYKIDLLDGRCGSCVKCCREFLYMVHLGVYDSKDPKISLFVDHCWDIVGGESKYTLMIDKYGKQVPLEKRWKNLLNQVS